MIIRENPFRILISRNVDAIKPEETASLKIGSKIILGTFLEGVDHSQVVLDGDRVTISTDKDHGIIVSIDDLARIIKVPQDDLNIVSRVSHLEEIAYIKGFMEKAERGAPLTEEYFRAFFEL